MGKRDVEGQRTVLEGKNDKHEGRSKHRVLHSRHGKYISKAGAAGCGDNISAASLGFFRCKRGITIILIEYYYPKHLKYIKHLSQVLPHNHAEITASPEKKY